MSKHDRSAATTPAFIISCERSGSTLLRYIVDTHPDIASPGELHLGQLCYNLYLTLSRTGGLVATDDEAERHTWVLAEVRRTVAAIMDSYATARGKRQWCEKTTMNIDHLASLYSVFPDARYICLYRNALDVAHSCIEAGRLGFLPEHIPYVHRSPHNLVAAMVENWIDKAQLLLTFEQQHPEQCWRVRYEDLVLHPAATLRPLFAFLGVEWDERIIAEVFSTHHDPGAGDSKVRFATNIYQTSIGKGASINRANIPERLLAELNTALAALDYPIIGPDWDTTPSPYLAMAAAVQQHAIAPDLAAIFDQQLPKQLRQIITSGQAPALVYKMIATGKGGGTWLIDLHNASNPVSVGEGEADCTLTMDSADLLALLSGQLNAAEAWLQGRLHVAGDINQAEWLGRILLSGTAAQASPPTQAHQVAR